MIFRKLLSHHIHHYLPILISLVYLTIMVNSYPLDGARPILLPGEHYNNNDFDESIVPNDVNNFLLVKCYIIINIAVIL